MTEKYQNKYRIASARLKAGTMPTRVRILSPFVLKIDGTILGRSRMGKWCYQM